MQVNFLSSTIVIWLLIILIYNLVLNLALWFERKKIIDFAVLFLLLV